VSNHTYVCRFIEGEPPGAMYELGVGPKRDWRALRKVYPGMKLFGCEPRPDMYERIVNRQKFPGMLIQVAIAKEEGTRTLHCSTENQRIASLYKLPRADASYQVETWTLDQFDRWAGWQERVLLWMDIEGSELEALQGGEELLESGRVRWINLEERRPGHRPTEGWCDPLMLRDFLEKRGYTRVASYGEHQSHLDAVYVLNDELKA
jgi:FkbM family methyltransferase